MYFGVHTKPESMKKSITLAAIVACFALGNAKAQTINGIKLADLKEEYLEVEAFRQAFSEKIFIWLEYGQKSKNRETSTVKDERGRNLEYNSVIDFVNKMKAYGYELFQVYAVNSTANSSASKYILKRKD